MWSQVGLRSITTNKASGGDGIPVKLFLVLKDDAVNVLHSICQQPCKTAVATGLEKISCHFIVFHCSKKGNAKEYSNYHTIVLISLASKVMLKILQARLQNYVNREFPEVQAGFRKRGELEIKLPTSIRSLKKQESSRKTSTSALLTMPKLLIVWITRNCGKFWKSWEYQTTWHASWETYMQVRKQQLEQWTGSKMRKEYV